MPFGLCALCLIRLGQTVGAQESGITLNARDAPFPQEPTSPANLTLFGDYELIEEILPGDCALTVHQHSTTRV